MSELLDKVKSQKRQKKRNDTLKEDFTEVALAWVKDEVGIRQIIAATNLTGGSIYCKLAHTLREYILKNQK